MKILMVNKFLYPRGGSESYMLKLGLELQKMGHEVEYFGMYDEKNTVFNSASEYTKNMDFHSRGIRRFLYPFKILYSFEAKKKIGIVLDKFKPDVVHMNNINFQLTPSIIYAVKERKIPLVWTVHDYQMICPNHLFYSFKKNSPCEKCLSGTSLNCLKNKCIHGSLVKSFLGVLESWLYKILPVYKMVDLYISPSDFLKNKLFSYRDFYKEKTYTIHNFIEKREGEEKIPKKPYIAFVGRLSDEKGIKLLKETADIMPQYDFLVAGSGPSEEMLLGSENIRLMGFLNGDELADFIKNARALILPSVCYENCPLSILEAHSLGTPVITMNYGGMAELVKNYKTGILVSSPEKESVAKAVGEVFDDEIYGILKENTEKIKDEIYTASEYAEKLLGLYDGLIAGGKNDKSKCYSTRV